MSHANVCVMLDLSCALFYDPAMLMVYMTQFAKTRHNDAFLEFQIFASVSFMYVPKALLCSNINAVLLIVYELQG